MTPRVATSLALAQHTSMSRHVRSTLVCRLAEATSAFAAPYSLAAPTPRAARLSTGSSNRITPAHGTASMRMSIAKNLWLKQSWGTAESGFDITFMGYDNTWNSADQIPERAVRSGLISDLGSVDTTVGGESSRYSLSSSWRGSNALGAVRASAYAIDYDMNLYSNFSYFIEPDGDQFQQLDDRKLFGGQVEQDLDFELGAVQVSNTFGAQLRTDTIDGVGLRSTREREFLGDIRFDSVDQSSVSTYWQSEAQWTQSLRYDRFDFDVTSLAAEDPTMLAANSGRKNDGVVTGSLGLIYTVDDSLELYANIGQGFHSNDARGVISRLDP